MSKDKNLYLKDIRNYTAELPTILRDMHGNEIKKTAKTEEEKE